MISRIDQRDYDEIDNIVTSMDNGRAVLELYRAAREITISPLCFSAAREIENVGAGSVFILTGFPVIIGETPLCETDGPLGVVRLVHGLSLLGMDVYTITSGIYGNNLLKLLNAEEEKTKCMIFRDLKHIEREMKDVLKKFSPDILISVELPGKAHDGRYYDMYNNDITPYVVPLDDMIEMACDYGVRTIGIGDGGNEAGMGWVADAVTKHVANGSRIASRIKTDSLVVASTSNWGAYGILTALSNLSGKQLLCNGRYEDKLFADANSLRLYDGKLREVKPSVDGFTLEDSKEIVSKLRDLVKFDDLASAGDKLKSV